MGDLHTPRQGGHGQDAAPTPKVVTWPLNAGCDSATEKMTPVSAVTHDQNNSPIAPSGKNKQTPVSTAIATMHG